MDFSLIFKGIQLLLAVFSEVHNVQASLGAVGVASAATGAQKSQAVIDKVTPIASVIGAETEHVQGLIDAVVSFSKAVKIGAFAGTAQAQEAP